MLPWRRRIFASGNLYNNKILSKCGNSLSLPIDKDQLDNLLYKGIALAFCSISLLLIMMMYLAHSLPQWWCISINTNGRGVRVRVTASSSPWWLQFQCYSVLPPIIGNRWILCKITPTNEQKHNCMFLQLILL